MSLIKIITEPAILIITAFFIFCIITVLKNYSKTEKNLKSVYKFLQTLNKKELSYRFNQLDEFMKNNSYTSTSWEDFKKALIFPEKFFTASQNTKGNYSPEIYLTVDAAYFFNEETLVTSRFNNKFLQAIPTVLTGFGPMFTFLNIAIAFGKVDFSSQEQTIASVASLMSSMQTAALVSVIAVGSSLVFLIFEKFAFQILCNKPLMQCEDAIGKLFDNISSEKFLLELLKETKIQNNSISNLITAMPEQFKVALNAGIAGNLVPYLENLMFGINQVNKNMKEVAKRNAGDDVDDLF